MKCLDCGKEFLVPKKLALHIEYFHKKPNYFVCPFEKCHDSITEKQIFRNILIKNTFQKILVIQKDKPNQKMRQQ